MKTILIEKTAKKLKLYEFIITTLLLRSAFLRIKEFLPPLYDKNSGIALLCYGLNQRVTETAGKTPLKTAKFTILFHVSPANG